MYRYHLMALKEGWIWVIDSLRDWFFHSSHYSVLYKRWRSFILLIYNRICVFVCRTTIGPSSPLNINCKRHGKFSSLTTQPPHYIPASCFPLTLIIDKRVPKYNMGYTIALIKLLFAIIGFYHFHHTELILSFNIIIHIVGTCPIVPFYKHSTSTFNNKRDPMKFTQSGLPLNQSTIFILQKI